MDDFDQGSVDAALTVSDLTAQVKDLLEAGIAPTWVSGEATNVSRPSSGHCYFTLKDDAAQIRAVMWRSTASRLRFDLSDGMELLCFGRIDVYPPRGSYQLVVTKAEPKGVGALELALRKLRDKLAAAGLFAAERKRPLPAFPSRVAFVTSPTGAAVRDFVEVLRRRWTGVDVLIVPTRVQGEGAAGEIAAAVRATNQLASPPQVIVVGRGGGSLEDLWCFNEEAVVRAVAASTVPVVSAVGHEIDVTLTDLAADVRALTPSEAAELVAPSTADLRNRVAQYRSRMTNSVHGLLSSLATQLQQLSSYRAFVRPSVLVDDRIRQVDELDARLGRSIGQSCSSAEQRLAGLAGKLQSLSPLDVLGRGYSVTTHAPTRRVIRGTDEVQPGDEIVSRLADGSIRSRVE